jgi:superfamily II DNA helicase RecQ
MPAFRIFGDRALLALAAARPKSEEALLAVPGLGPKTVERYGQALIALLTPRRPD